MKKRKKLLPLFLALILDVLPSRMGRTGCRNAGRRGSGDRTSGIPGLPKSYYTPVATDQVEGWPKGPAVWADAAVVMDYDTGTILYAKEMDKQEYPASITKR